MASTRHRRKYTITKDIGGVIGIYLAHYTWLKDTHIIVDGLCNSACTLVLANEDVCVTDKAWFGFHPASNEAGTAILMGIFAKAPEFLAERIARVRSHDDHRQHAAPAGAQGSL